MMDRSISFRQLVDETAAKFSARFGRQPQIIVAAPGRVNLIGEHTDYNDGFVMPMAIERYMVLAADKPSDASQDIQWHCAKMNETATIPCRAPIGKGQPKWSNYIRGALAGVFQQGLETGPLRVVMNSNVPLGGGLSSSAALEVATATLAEAATGRTLDPVQKALICQKAEHDFAGVPCGIMDQFISVMGTEGHFLLLDCRSRKTELVPMADPEIAVLISNTNVKHELTGGEYAQRRSQCEEAARILGVPALRDATLPMLEAAKSKLTPVVFNRARHVIGENDRTVQAAQALKASNWNQVGKLMYASHDSLRDDYEVSCKELDILVEIAREIGVNGGVIGSRMTGGGFGGCTVSLVRAKSVEAIAAKLHDSYKQRTGIEPAIFLSRPAAGASIVKK